jgi:hypothetical protein
VPALLAGLAVATGTAGVLPTNRLPLAVGGYAAGFFAVVGLFLIGAWWLDRRPGGRVLAARPRQVAAAAVLFPYAAAAIAVPSHLGLIHAVPVGARWWLLPVVAGCVAVLLLGAQLVAGRTWWWPPVVLAGTAVAVLAATLAGLAPGFVLLVLPLLVVLFGWQAGWALVLRRSAAPAWLAAAVGAVVVGWPIATALPLAAP